MPDINFNLDVYCGECGEGLCEASSFTYRPRRLEVGHCINCYGALQDEIKELAYKINELEDA